MKRNHEYHRAWRQRQKDLKKNEKQDSKSDIDRQRAFCQRNVEELA